MISALSNAPYSATTYTSHPRANLAIAGRYALVWRIKDSGEQRNEDDTGNGPRPSVTAMCYAKGHSGLFAARNAKASRLKISGGISGSRLRRYGSTVGISNAKRVCAVARW